MSINLCSTCQHLTIESLAEGIQYGLAASELVSRKERCHCCMLIHEAIGHLDPDRGNDIVRLSGIIAHVLDPDNPDRRASRNDLGDIRIYCTNGQPPPEQQPCGMIRAFATPDCPKRLRAVIPRRPVVSPGSNEALKRCREWLTHCLTHHKQCRRGLSGAKYDDLKAPSALPTRVIDVSAAPSLVIPQDVASNYVALSYCWGAAHRDPTSKPPFLLTKGTFKAFQTSLPHEDLPRTIQDAIHVTKQLGYKYLWVDSLCIIQDSAEDWSYESQRMGQIFQNATFTIAATAAASSSDGLFRRPHADIEILEDGSRRENFIRIPVTLRGRTLGELCLAAVTRGSTVSDPPQSLQTELSNSSWNDRAWVVQEKLLSRRILHFGRTQLFFECQEGEWTESFSLEDDVLDPGELLRPEAKSSVFQRLTREFSFGKMLASSSETLRSTQTRAMVAYDSIRACLGLFDPSELDDARFRFWTRVLWHYNVTHLTRDSDKLVAILGLGKMLQSRLRMTYCAGAWVEDIACSLYWWADEPMPNSQVRRLEPVHGSGAPSWSWAAWRGPIAFATFMSYLDNTRPRVVNYCDQSQTPGAPRSFIEITAYAWEANLRTTSHNSGARHPLTEWTIQWEPQITSEPFVLFPCSDDDIYEIVWHVPGSPTAVFQGLARCDRGSAELGDDLECLCLVLSSTDTFHVSQPKSFGYYVLIVRPAKNEPDAYERVGIGVCMSAVDCLSQRWYGYAPPTQKFLLI